MTEADDFFRRVLAEAPLEEVVKKAISEVVAAEAGGMSSLLDRRRYAAPEDQNLLELCERLFGSFVSTLLQHKVPDANGRDFYRLIGSALHVDTIPKYEVLQPPYPIFR